MLENIVNRSEFVPVHQRIALYKSYLLLLRRKMLKSDARSLVYIYIMICTGVPPEVRSCVKVEVDVLGLSVLMSLTVFVDVKQH